MERKLDELGRIVVPVEYRRQLGWQEKDILDMYVSDNSLIVKKSIDSCIFCTAALNLVKIGNICVCRDCIERLHSAKDGEILYPCKAD